VDEPLDYAERWLRDGLSVVRPSFSVVQITVDMTHASSRLEELRKRGVQATSTHLLVHAAARALAAHPQLHQIVAGNRRRRPAHVDIGLSITGETFVAPVLIIERADQKSVAEIAEETTRRAPEIRKADQQMLRMLRRWGRIVPFGMLRRALLRLMFKSAAFRQKGAGTFQVSTVPADWALSSAFSTAGVVIGGQTRLRVIAIDGRPEVRPTMTVTLSGDHGVWDGRAAVRFLAAVKGELEIDPENRNAAPLAERGVSLPIL
jgi:pyruvate/2-oxoglutarate dehydrogenase complex dihydrolipoamide acyltransferase (E2) component